MSRPEHEAQPRSRASFVLLLTVLAVVFAGFVTLGSWQVQRRAWKLDLIQRVEQRVQAAPVAAPGRDAWGRIDTGSEYLRVGTQGVFLAAQQVLTQAVTERGPGYWVMTPLRLADGRIVLVNRGFVESAAQAALPADSVAAVTGLLRLSEPGGGFLRRNDPAAQRWFSRDVAAIAAAQGLPAQDVAPYFIDADRQGDTAPIGGMTVLRFHNSHLVYAITWYALALMTAVAAAIVWRQRARRASA